MEPTNVGDICNSFFPKELRISGRWELIICDENKRIKGRDFNLVKIKEIQVPPNSIVVPINILSRHGAEIVDVIISERQGFIDSVVLYSAKSFHVMTSEVLGVLKISNAVPFEKSGISNFIKIFKPIFENWKYGLAHYEYYETNDELLRPGTEDIYKPVRG